MHKVCNSKFALTSGSTQFKIVAKLNLKMFFLTTIPLNGVTCNYSLYLHMI